MPISSSRRTPQDIHESEARVRSSSCPASLWPITLLWPVLQFRQVDSKLSSPPHPLLQTKKTLSKIVWVCFLLNPMMGLNIQKGRLPLICFFLFLFLRFFPNSLLVHRKAHIMLSGWHSDPEGHTDFQEELGNFRQRQPTAVLPPSSLLSFACYDCVIVSVNLGSWCNQPKKEAVVFPFFFLIKLIKWKSVLFWMT